MLNVKRLIFEEYQRQRSIPFAWGSADCLRFVADVAKLLTGNDPAAVHRGAYDSDISAKRFLISHQWRTLGDLAASMYPEIPVAFAKAGDWAFIVNDDGTETLGVVNGSQIVARTKDGLGIHILTKASRAFRVVK